ncbi:MAG: LssY C-terminal domain-containing protein [Planctomycetota bacterium]
MDAPTESEPSSAVRKRARLWTAVARGVGVFLLCYVAISYLIVPQIWKSYARHRPSFDDNPRLTKTGDGHPGDALNVAVTGTESELTAIMSAAKWYPADPLGLRSDLRIGVDTVLERPYDEAPVSNLFLYSRREDFAFEQPVGNDPRHRHHVRFWRSEQTDQGRPIWMGAATYDERVGLSHTTGQITHHTAPNIDTERAHVIETLQQTNDLAEMYKVPGFHTQLEGKNGGGDRWVTDGALWVGVIEVGVHE